MEAPEKIYICDFSSGLSQDWCPERCFEKDIEYVRTDAFIEKVCEWLQENAYLYVNDYTGNLNEKMLVQEFKDYIKGE